MKSGLRTFCLCTLLGLGLLTIHRLPAQITDTVHKNDTLFLITRPLHNHVKLYATDLMGLAFRNGRIVLGREFMLRKAFTGEFDLGLRIFPEAVVLDFPLAFGWPFLRKTKAGPYAAVAFRVYPKLPIVSDRSRHFAGFHLGTAADISQVSFHKLGIYTLSADRLVNTQNAYDADVYSFRIIPFIGYSEFFRGNTAPGRKSRGLTIHTQLGWTFDWEKIVGDIEQPNSNVIRADEIRMFRMFPSWRLGFGYGF